DLRDWRERLERRVTQDLWVLKGLLENQDPQESRALQESVFRESRVIQVVLQAPEEKRGAQDLQGPVAQLGSL
ncbi:hypothetical protein lerEdw1_000783, partial [Lerista edwardsae]